MLTALRPPRARPTVPFDVRTIDPEPPSLGDTLRALRDGGGLKMTYVAEQLGCSQSSLSQFESGARTPNALMFRKLGEFYGVDYRELREIDDAHKAWRQDNAEKLRRLDASVVVVVGNPAVLRLLAAVGDRPDAHIDKLVANLDAAIAMPDPPARPRPRPGRDARSA